MCKKLARTIRPTKPGSGWARQGARPFQGLSCESDTTGRPRGRAEPREAASSG